MQALATYLRDSLSRKVYVQPEVGFYPYLHNLLNAVGEELKPVVLVAQHGRQVRGKSPDYAFFTQGQLPEDGRPFVDGRAIRPDRGVLEAKGHARDLETLIKSKQVVEYLKVFEQVLVTNLREFAIVQLVGDKPREIERYSLALSEAEFWALAEDPESSEIKHGQELYEFLTRALLASIRIDNPKELAFFLASYARQAKHRIDLYADELRLPALQEELQAALGVTFERGKGEEFFRSTLVQTLFYGIFSAWVLWHEESPEPEDRFDWRITGVLIDLPVLSALFRSSADRRLLGESGLRDLMNSVGRTLNRVERRRFFRRFEDAVQYFYEPFLRAFDPELRAQLGVWYTPSEVVRYMVARVDETLRDVLGEPDGLASPNVIVLDPCCGTGAYLVECLRVIAERLEAQHGALAGPHISKAVARLKGFELLLAPLVVSHMQVGLALRRLGLRDAEVRPPIYLTNALTGWNRNEYPPQATSHELDIERKAADEVKDLDPILVVLGNPPYNGKAPVSIQVEEIDLVSGFDSGRRVGQGLNDLYIRFFAMADRRIRKTGRGIVCLISNSGWLVQKSHDMMRAHLLADYDRIAIDNLNGDRDATGKRTPWGTPDPSVFATRHNSNGIKEGVAITLMVRREEHRPAGVIEYRDFWGVHKRDRLVASLTDGAITGPTAGTDYDEYTPLDWLNYRFVPALVGADYQHSPLLIDLLPNPFPGVKTSRDPLLIETELIDLESKMKAFFDPTVSDESFWRAYPATAPKNETKLIDAAKAFRQRFAGRRPDPNKVVPYTYRAFDSRILYYDEGLGLIDRERGNFARASTEQNLFIEARAGETNAQWSRGTVSRYLADNFGNGLSSWFPLRRQAAPLSLQTGLDLDPEVVARAEKAARRSGWNLSEMAWDYLERMGVEDAPDLMFYHALATMHSPAYARENAGALQADWPRIPLPKDSAVLRASAELGRRVATLLDPEAEAPGVTLGDVPDALLRIAAYEWRGTGRYPQGEELSLTDRWGYYQNNAVMAGEEQDKTIWHTGPAGVTVDVRMNPQAFWTGIPKAVWDYTLGGYRVLKKWLSYRDRNVLGRPLHSEEIEDFSRIARRIAALLALGPELDTNLLQIASQDSSLSSGGEGGV